MATEKEKGGVPWDQALNLHQRMVLVMGDCGAIAKEGKADQKIGGYAFVRHDDVAREVRKHLVQRGVLCISTVEEHELEVRQTKGGGMMLATTFKVLTTFCNADKPDEVINIQTWAYGLDSSDKGPGKAWTYAKKNALINALLLPTGADLEDESPTLPSAAPEQREEPTSAPAPKASNKGEIFKQIAQIVTDADCDPELLKAHLKAKGYDSAKSVPLPYLTNLKGQWEARGKLWTSLQGEVERFCSRGDGAVLAPEFDPSVMAMESGGPFEMEFDTLAAALAGVEEANRKATQGTTQEAF